MGCSLGAARKLAFLTPVWSVPLWSFGHPWQDAGCSLLWLAAVSGVMITTVVSWWALAILKTWNSMRRNGMGGISRSLAVLQRAFTLLRPLLMIGVLGLMLAAGYWVYEIWNEKTVYEQYLHN